MGAHRYHHLTCLLSYATPLLAHGHVSSYVINGVYYQGYGSTSFPYMSNPPAVAGWTIDAKDNGFVSPDAYGNPDIICHKSATPGEAHIQVRAGDSISLQWTEWPESHHGPMIDYLAACNGPCETVDKTTLEFFKIDGAGIADPSVPPPGFWADDVMIANNNTWLVQIPSSIKAGNYVLRHETIALHAGGNPNGAQNYPQCINLEIVGSGSTVPAGVKGTALYKATDPGILFNIYTGPLDYTVPGPALMAGVPISVAQSSSRITASASGTLGSGGGGGEVTTSTTSTRTTTTASEPATTSGSGNGVPLYGQCGGIGYSGPTTCASGTCTKLNDYYSQCT